MYSWSDMAKVKRDLWNKLHAVKDIMKKKAINMVQMISASMPQQVNDGFKQLYSYTQPEAIAQKEQPLALGQVNSFSDSAPEETKDEKKPEQSASQEESQVSSKMMKNREPKKQPRTLKVMTPNGMKVDHPDTGVSSIKHNNTRATMILYFCIMTVLMCCCLGRCLVVPLS